MTRLHVLNGDATAHVFNRSGIGGEIAVWREMLVEGPVGTNLSLESIGAQRAAHFESHYGVPAATYLAELTAQSTLLANCSNFEEVVLWSEADLFCQINLFYLLARFAEPDLENTQLFLVYAAADGGGALRGLGARQPEELDRLLAQRRAVHKNEKLLGRQAWQAYAAAEPQQLCQLAFDGAGPLVGPAFQCHLDRFPSARNGLNDIEETALRELENGGKSIFTLFSDVSRHPHISRYGMGDLQFWSILQDLRQAPVPLIQIDGPAELPRFGEECSPDRMRQYNCTVTNDGVAALSGRMDHVEVNGIDRWLGGVFLRGKDVWRWDSVGRELIRR